jgi:hypothetical protein
MQVAAPPSISLVTALLHWASRAACAPEAAELLLAETIKPLGRFASQSIQNEPTIFSLVLSWTRARE